MSKNPTVEVVQPAADVVVLPVKMIHADAKKNTRSGLGDLSGLARVIKNEGQQNPVIVAKRKDGKGYDLVAGYRRFAAVSWPKEKGGLEEDTIKATIREEQSDLDRLKTNLIENFAREDLGSYDAAKAFSSLREMLLADDKKLSGDKVPDRIGNMVDKSMSFVKNMLRAWDHVPDKMTLGTVGQVTGKQATMTLRDVWQSETEKGYEDGKFRPTLTTDRLAKLGSEKWGNTEVDEETKVAWYLEQIGIKPKTAPTEGEGGGTPNPAGAHKRPGKKHLAAALAAAEAAKTATKASDKEKITKLNGMIAALKFATGDNKTIPGVFVPGETAANENEEESDE